MNPTLTLRLARLFLVALALACASPAPRYQDRQMDFGAVKTVAVLPFTNLSRESQAADRVRDVFANLLLATGAIYVVPQGEVQRALGLAGVQTPTSPSSEEVLKLGKALKADAVIIGVVKEYGEIRAGSAAGNVVSLSLQMQETATGKVVWSAASTKGGITAVDRLLGSGGTPMNQVTEAAVDELITQLFR